MAASITTTATTLEGQMLEVALAIQAKEALTVNTTGAVNNLQVTVDVEGGSVSIVSTLPATFTSSGGSLQVVPTAYLT